MSSPRPAAAHEGLLGTMASGYRLAWTARRPLFAVLAPVVAAMLLASSLLDVALGNGRLIIIDGAVRPIDGDVLAWAKLASTVSFGLVGLVGGAWAVARGTGPAEALRHGLTHLPAFVIGLVAAAAVTVPAVQLVAGTVTGRFTPVLIIAMLVAAALVAARILLVGIAWAVEGSDRRPRWSAAGSLLLGGVAVPLLLAYGLGRAAVAVGAGGAAYAGGLVTAALVFVALAAHVGLVVHPHVRDTAGRRPDRLWPGGAMVAAAVLVSAGTVVANPYAAPSVRTHDRGPAGPMAVAWPAGQHPVIVTSGGVWFCEDDLCEDVTDVHGGPPTVDGYGAAAIGADGTVVKTAVTGGPDTGGPFVSYARCVRDGCRAAWLPVRATGTEKLDEQARVEVAGAAAPDGALWFFVAAPVTGGRFGRYRLSLIRCADVACASPRRHQVGVTDRTPEDGYRDGHRARLSVDASGRPVASFWIGGSILRYTCEPVTCGTPQESASDAAPPDAIWDAAGDRTVAFRGGELYDGATGTPIAGDVVPSTGALAVDGREVYIAAAQPGAPDTGFHLTIGEPVTWWRQTVWRCRGARCVRSPMDVYAGDARRELLAVAPDGRVLVVRDNHVALLETPLT